MQARRFRRERGLIRECTIFKTNLKKIIIFFTAINIAFAARSAKSAESAGK